MEVLNHLKKTPPPTLQFLTDALEKSTKSAATTRLKEKYQQELKEAITAEQARQQAEPGRSISQTAAEDDYQRAAEEGAEEAALEGRSGFKFC